MTRDSNRRRYAQESEYFNRQNDIYCELFGDVDVKDNNARARQGDYNQAMKQLAAEYNQAGSPSKSGGNKASKRSRLNSAGQAGSPMIDSDEDEDVCRFCLAPGDLHCPCECKGSNRFVHIGCLRQWQKSVLLTQSTHPTYQTKID